MKSQKEYTAKPGRCPCCDSCSIEGGSVEVDSGLALQAVFCLCCSASWTDVYSLINYVIERPGSIEARWIEDPGHAWLEVPIHLVKSLGIYEEFSHYSYQDTINQLVYLEEDCDGPIFLMRAEQAGIKVHLRTEYKDVTQIRQMAPMPQRSRAAFNRIMQDLQNWTPLGSWEAEA